MLFKLDKSNKEILFQHPGYLYGHIELKTIFYTYLKVNSNPWMQVAYTLPNTGYTLKSLVNTEF